MRVNHYECLLRMLPQMPVAITTVPHHIKDAADRSDYNTKCECLGEFSITTAIGR